MAGKRNPLLLKLMARLGELTFEEKYIPDSGGHPVYAEWFPEGKIVVNPVRHIVDSVIHEGLHEMYPKYSERAILSLTGKLMKQLTEEDLLAVYESYRRKLDE